MREFIVGLTILIFVLSGCTSSSKTKLSDAEWSCANTNLAEFERREKGEYLKVKCK